MLRRSRTRVRWTGCKKALKAYQEYSAGFGAAIHKLFEAHQQDIKDQVSAQRVHMQSYVDNPDWVVAVNRLMQPPYTTGWEDAELQPVMAYLCSV